ncbi:neprilysin-4 [Leptinotarsa decemlineata]|uniref:neprilysin-4 n=1 Tax=Leptinotarsa decemlineata TaxID=7539 RepID=UPI003D309B5A
MIISIIFILLHLTSHIKSRTFIHNIHWPFHLRRYDQFDILQEDEDKRDILRDIKTVYAPENRIYTNDSICRIHGKRKRASKYHCQEEEESCFEGIHQKSESHVIDEDNTISKIERIIQDIFPEIQNTTVKIPLENINQDSINYTTEIQDYPDETNNLTALWHTIDPKKIRSIQSKIMQKYMDPSIDPCTDFYEFSCGNWKKYYTIPPDRATYDTFEMVRESLDNALKGLLERIDKKPPKKQPYFFEKSFIDEDFSPHDTSDAVIKAGVFYKSCMQEELIAKRGVDPLERILDELGGWPMVTNRFNSSEFDLFWLLARLRLLNNDVLIAQWVGPDMKNSNEYIVHIDQTTLGLPSRDYYLEYSNMKYIRAYKVFILTIVELMGGQLQRAENETEELIQFEMKLAQIMASPEERRNISDIYLRTDLASLTLYFPQFNWKDYFDIVLGTDIDLKTPVACYCARFIHELLYLVSITDPRILQNYLIWRFVRHRTNNLDRRFLDAKQRFYYILFGREKNPPRWEFCVSQVNSNMGMALGAMFVKKYFDQSSKMDTIEMTKDLEESFRTTLVENSWLDNNTKDYALMKLDNIDLKIGFPDFILNDNELAMRYDNVEVHPDYFFENVLTILRHLTRVEQKRLGSVVNRTMWSTPPAVVNAYYSRNKNQIMFPAGMLQPPFYNRHFPKALNFGGIGVVIGHEITHGFDDKGRLFDHEGNLHMWWRDSSIEKFYEKSQCMIEQYGQYVLPDIHVSLDGYMTQGENIADNGGLKQSYRAYETWLQKNPDADETLPGLNLTNRQLFFLNFAQVWCGQQRIEAAKSRMKTSVHSPGIFRVIGVLSNSVEFSKAYNCPVNSPMNPEFKCTIW